MEVEASGDSAFPTILFSNPSAGMKYPSRNNFYGLLINYTVCGNIHYHTGCILLLETGKIPDKSSAMVRALFYQISVKNVVNVHLIQASPICHARRIAGISATNNNQ
jgi:hypothetical protein